MQSSYLCVLTVYKVIYLFRLVSVSDKQPFQVDSKNVKELIFIFCSVSFPFQSFFTVYFTVRFLLSVFSFSFPIGNTAL